MKHAIRNIEKPSTHRTALDGLVSPAVALHLETTGPLCADLFMSALRGSDTQPHKDTAIFLHSESWFDVSSTERSFPSNHSSVNRPRSEAPQNNNNNNNDDDDDENNSPARRRLLCPHLARWVRPTASSPVLNTNLLTGVMLLKDAGPLRCGHTVLHLPCSGARVCARARVLRSRSAPPSAHRHRHITIKHNK